jgi:hypothetical protein
MWDMHAQATFFMTTAFLGLLDKGSRGIEGYSASVINITTAYSTIKTTDGCVRLSLSRSSESIKFGDLIPAVHVFVHCEQGSTASIDEGSGYATCSIQNQGPSQRDRPGVFPSEITTNASGEFTPWVKSLIDHQTPLGRPGR